MLFDGSSSREGSGAGVVLISPSNETLSLYFKLKFKTTNNIREYEALILGLRDAKDLRIQNIQVFKDFELIIQ